MDAVSQRTRSKKVQETQDTLETKETQETLETQETQETQYKMLQESDTTENTEDTSWDHAVRDSLDDRMDNYVSAMLYTAIHYPRFFVAMWVLVLVALSVLAVSTQKLPA